VQEAVFRRRCELCASPEAARGCKSECGAIPGAGIVGHEARDAETDTLALQPSQGHPPAAKRWTLGWRAPRGGPRGCAALWEATADLLHGWHSRHVAECLPRRLPAPAAQTLTSLLGRDAESKLPKLKVAGSSRTWSPQLPGDAKSNGEWCFPGLQGTVFQYSIASHRHCHCFERMISSSMADYGASRTPDVRACARCGIRTKGSSERQAVTFDAKKHRFSELGCPEFKLSCKDCLRVHSEQPANRR